MIDFFSDHPVITTIIAILLIFGLVIGGVLITRHSRNILFGGNEQVFDTNWRYEWAIIQLGNGELLEGKITSWKDFDKSDMIQFTMDGITYLTHSSNVLLCTKRP